MLLLRKPRRFWFPSTYSVHFKQQVLQKHTMAGQMDAVCHSPVGDNNSTLPEGCFDPSNWKRMNSRSLGIDNSQIDSAALLVLKILKNKGFGAYLVGGCVRDLILHKTPKDFDIVTTADLRQIKKQFHHALIVGRRFPICLVHLKGSCIEVSSFETKNKKTEERQTTCFQSHKGLGHEDLSCWRDCISRDFTINGLFYDPATNTIYDYVNGIRDIKELKLQTVMPANTSFKEDCARILRGIRIAARLGLIFSSRTKMAMLKHSQSIMSLPTERLMMEMNYMLAYGAAVPSICLLQRFKLLDILLPFHASYLAQKMESQTTKGSTLLMNLLSKMDDILAADQPSDCRLWLGLLALHLALVQYPQDSDVVWAFSFILCHGNLSKAIKSTKEKAKSCSHFLPEISCFSGNKSDELLIEEVSHFVSLVKSSIKYLMSPDALSKALERCHMPSSSSSMVFVSKNMGRQVAELFDLLDSKDHPNAIIRESNVINYNLLKKGESNETRFVLGKIIMDVLNERMKPEISSSSINCIEEKTENRVKNEQELSHIFSEVVNGLDVSSSGIEQGQTKHFQEQKIEGNKMGFKEVNHEQNKQVNVKRKKKRNQTDPGSVQYKHRQIFKEGKEETQVISKKKRIFWVHGDLELENHVVFENKFKRSKEDKIRQENTGIQLDIQTVGKAERNMKKKKIKQENCEVLREKKNEPKSLLSKLFQ